jgi:hypothetical protein
MTLSLNALTEPLPQVGIETALFPFSLVSDWSVDKRSPNVSALSPNPNQYPHAPRLFVWEGQERK